MSTLFHNILRAAASAMEIPVVICLLLAFSVFSLGWWLAELLELTHHPDFTSALRESLAVNLLEKRGKVYYDAKTGTYYIIPNAAGN